MRSFEFNMALSAEKTRRIYAGSAQNIVVQCDDGLKLQLPAANFRDYVGNHGINGRFSVTIDNGNRIIELRRLRA